MVFVLLLLLSTNALSGTITVNSFHSDPSAKKAFMAVVESFEKANPEDKVKVNLIDHESYKIQIRTWLPNHPPDVATWFAGHRARIFIEKDLIEPIDSWFKPIESQFSTATLEEIRWKEKTYLLPTTYYHWGFYYRKDLFAKAQITSPPKTWAELLEVCKKLKAAGMSPLALGAKEGWPAAAWFDYLNLRLHGAEFYKSLLNGKESYLDPRVTESLSYWKELIDLKAFPENASALTWQEATSLMWQGKAGMTLMGHFLYAETPQSFKDQLGFFPFPKIKEVPLAEVAPIDVYFVPKKAKNKEGGQKFLKHLATPEVQALLAEKGHLLATNLKASVKEADPLQTQGAHQLQQASRLLQFFDRDTDPEIAKVGMDGFVQLLSFPNEGQKILENLERVRKKVHK